MCIRDSVAWPSASRTTCGTGTDASDAVLLELPHDDNPTIVANATTHAPERIAVRIGRRNEGALRLKVFTGTDLIRPCDQTPLRLLRRVANDAGNRVGAAVVVVT